MAIDVKAAVRALRLFETFTAEGRPLTMTELATRLDIPPSSCLLLIRTFLRRGYLYETTVRGNYYPTRRMLEQVSQIAARDPVVEFFRAPLMALRDRTEETVTLAKRQGDRAVYLAIFDSPQVVKPTVLVGTLRPLYSTAVGKALLGGMDEAPRRELLARLEIKRITGRTITSRPALEAELVKSADRGWYSNEGETIDDLSGVAMPVRLADDVLAVSVIAPTYRLKPLLKKHVLALARTCSQMQHEFASTRSPVSSTRRGARSRRMAGSANMNGPQR